MDLGDSQQRLIAGAALLLATVAFVRLLLGSRARGKRLPPTIPGAPVVGGLIKFMRGPIPMIREEYARLGSVFTVPILSRRITFLIGPEVSAHFFKGNEAEMSQQEVYRFNVPTFGPGVVFDVDYSVRQEQFRFFTEALRATKLRSYVDQMVAEAEVRIRFGFLHLFLDSELFALLMWWFHDCEVSCLLCIGLDFWICNC